VRYINSKLYDQTAFSEHRQNTAVLRQHPGVDRTRN